jgi:PAS domain-containing protein
VRLLLVDESANSAARIARGFEQGDLRVDITRVEDRARLRAALQAGEWDAIVCSYSFPGFDALTGLADLRAIGHDIPLIVVAGRIGEENAVAVMRAGASDCVLADDLARLPAAVQRAMEEAHSAAKARAIADKLRRQCVLLKALVGSAMDAIITLDSDQRIVLFNPAAEAMFGWRRGEILGQPLDRLLPAAFREVHRQHIARFGESGATSRSMRV